MVKETISGTKKGIVRSQSFFKVTDRSLKSVSSHWEHFPPNQLQSWLYIFTRKKSVVSIRSRGKKLNRRKPLLLYSHLSHLMGKPTICICETKTQISAFVFATRIVQSLLFLKTKFHASSCLLLLCSPVCVEPGRKPQRWFSHEAAHLFETEIRRSE